MSQLKKRERELALPLPFCFIWGLSPLDDAHLPWGGPLDLLSSPIQVLIFSRNTVTDIPGHNDLVATAICLKVVKLTRKINYHSGKGKRILKYLLRPYTLPPPPQPRPGVYTLAGTGSGQVAAGKRGCHHTWEKRDKRGGRDTVCSFYSCREHLLYLLESTPAGENPHSRITCTPRSSGQKSQVSEPSSTWLSLPRGANQRPSAVQKRNVPWLWSPNLRPSSRKFSR